jgi:hypothetical protein
MLKIKNCWMIIKKFGFNENLELSGDTLDDSFIELKYGRSVELSKFFLELARKMVRFGLCQIFASDF